MTYQIILLNAVTNPDSSFSVNGVFWLTANSNNIVPLPNFVSQVPFIDITDLNLLQIGTIVEQSFNSGNFVSGTTLATVQSTLQAEYSAAQTNFNAFNPALAQMVGTAFNGSSWTTSSPFNEVFQDAVFGNLGALNAVVQIDATGSQSIGLQIAAGTFIGTMVPEVSFDNGNTWTQTVFSTVGYGNKLAGISFASANTAFAVSIVVNGGVSTVRVRAFAYTSGTCNITLRGSNINDPSLQVYVAQPGSALPSSYAITGGSVTTSAPTYSNSTTNALSLNASGGLRVDGSGVTQPISIAANVTTVQGASVWTDNITEIGGVSVAAVAKGTQASNALGTQDLKDSGRVAFVAVASAVTGVTTEALLTMTPVRTVTAGSAATTFAVTSGKTMRIQAIFVNVKSTTAAIESVVCHVRMNSTTVTATSQLFFSCGVSTLAATSGSNNGEAFFIPDGFEISGTTQFGISQLASSTSCTVDVTLVGFEY